MKAPLATRALLRLCLPRDRYEAIAGDLSEIFAAERRRALLARGVARQKELGIRAALGAGRLRLLRQLLTESLLLTVLGAALGTLMAAWAIDALRGTLPEVVLATTPNLHALSMNPRTLGFAAIVSIATGMLFGVIPAVRIGRQDAHAVLRETGRTGAGRGSQRLRAMLVAGEVALSFVLLTATA